MGATWTPSVVMSAICNSSQSLQEEAHFLTKYGSKVYVIHRRDTLRASKVMQQRAKDNPKIEFIWDSAVKEAYGNERGLLGGVKVENLKTGAVTDLEVWMMDSALQGMWDSDGDDKVKGMNKRAGVGSWSGRSAVG